MRGDELSRRGVEHALRQAAVPPTHYWIEGVREASPAPTDFLHVCEDPGRGRETGVYERGSHETIARHPAEGSGCAHLWQLPNRVPPYTPQGAYGSECTLGPTLFDQALPAVASQFVDQVIAPRRPG